MSLVSYAYGSNKQLTEHFNCNEFQCKCGKAHEYKIDSVLLDKLEQLFKALNCTKIIVNSGYRCVTHDKNVGGSGNGQHVIGTACDIKCYDSNGIINTKKVACVAQDIGFTGIGNIDSTYTAIHVDVRSSGTWKGDEAKGHTNTVTNDYYSYYGLSKSDVYPVSTSSQHTVEMLIDGKSVYKGVIK